LRIAVASGKGGTGKTTVAVNLALSLDNVQLLDCDVEEPDCHLFLGLDLEKVEDVNVSLPIVDESKCNLCGKCAELCFFNAIVVTPKKALVFPELCHGCGLCLFGCSQGAIAEGKRVVGKVERGKGEIKEFYHGVLTTGEAMTPAVIRAVKKRIGDEKTAIIDAPPGNACPVIEAVEGSDFCILVTEPTPFGLYDLKLSRKMLGQLEIPHGVIVNRDGIGDRRVEDYCEKEGVPVLMKIPYDEKIARLYSRGIPFVREMPEWKVKFLDLYNSIREAIT
jgi:MinD superfamily P-loop ATPase